MSYSYSVPYISNNDIDNINNIRAWLIQNLKRDKWTTWTTQRSKIYEFIFFSKRDYTTFLLRCA